MNTSKGFGQNEKHPNCRSPIGGGGGDYHGAARQLFPLLCHLLHLVPDNSLALLDALSSFPAAKLGLTEAFPMRTSTLLHIMQ
jgi:hypothetical protein